MGQEQKTTKLPSVGVIVGRFQVENLHTGHHHLIDYVNKRHTKLIIFLGLSPLKTTRNNPLDFPTRKKMIEKDYPDAIVLYIKDLPCDELWSKNLDGQLKDVIGPETEVTLYGSRESFIDYYHGKFQTHELIQEVFESGTEIRKHISVTAKSTKDFREGVIWATCNQYKKIYPTVDIAIWDDDYKRLLMARKPNEKLYRFVGGFVDEETLERACRREVAEETHLEISDPQYVGSFVVDDWRYRREFDSIVTTLFEAKRVFGKPTPDDDIAELKWFDVSTIRPDDLVEAHRPLLEGLLAKRPESVLQPKVKDEFHEALLAVHA